MALLVAATGVRAADWLAEYPFRTPMTIDSNLVDADLTNFPVLVRLTAKNFDFAVAATDGRDIRFAGADGSTLLPFEREAHDASAQTAAYWVRIPRVSASLDTTFYLYCGKLGAADGANPTAVWDEEHVAVWHLNQSNGVTQADATAAGNMLTVSPVGLAHGDVIVSDCDSTAGWSVTGPDALVAVDTATTDTAVGSTSAIKLTVASTVAGQTNALVFLPDAPLALGNRQLDFFESPGKNLSSGFVQARLYIFDANGNYRDHNLAADTGINLCGFGLGSGGMTGGVDPDVNAIVRIEWRFISANDTPYTFHVDSLTASGALEEGTPAAIAGGVSLAGNSNYLITAPLDIDTTNGLSISAWVRPHVAQVYWPYYTPLVSMGGANWYPYSATYLAYNTGGFAKGGCNASTVKFADGTSLAGSVSGVVVGEWHHVTATYYYDAEAASTTMKIYVDGVLKNAFTTPGRALLPRIDRPACVGAKTHHPYPSMSPREQFQGALDEVRLEKTVRSEAWVKASYLSQKTDGALLRLSGTESRSAWVPRWKRRRAITIAPGAVAADLAHFPVLVRLNADNFDFAQATPDGSDIRFLSGDGRQFLEFERESHDAALQTAAYWVRLPFVSSSEETTFYLYDGGRSGTPDSAKPFNVWDEGHVAVWHLHQTNGVTQADSTASGITLTVGPAGLDRGDVLISACDNTTDWSVTGDDISLKVDTVTRDTVAGSPSALTATVAATAADQVHTVVYDPADPLVLGNRRLNFYLNIKSAPNLVKSTRVYLYDVHGNYRWDDFSKGSGYDQVKGFGIASGGTTGGTAPDVNAIDRIEWVLVSAGTTPYSVTIDSLAASGALDEGIPGVVDRAVSLNGLDHFLMTAATVIDTTNGLTLSAWVRARDYDFYSTRSYQGIVATGGGNVGPYYQTLLGYYKLRKLYGLASVNKNYDSAYPTGASVSGPGDGFTTGVWHHVASVFRYDHETETTSMKLYLDGVLKLEKTVDGLALRSVLNKYFCVGAVTWSAYPSNNPIYNFGGELDEVRISNVARGDAWLAASFQNQRAGGALLTVGHVEPPPGTLIFLR